MVQLSYNGQPTEWLPVTSYTMTVYLTIASHGEYWNFNTKHGQ